MIVLDVNVLVGAHRDDVPEHDRMRAYLQSVLGGPSAVGAPEQVLTAFVRITTNRRIFRIPTDVSAALVFVAAARARDTWLEVAPNDRTWATLERVLAETGVSGDDVPDAYLAALAISGGDELASGDRGFGRFADLRWTNPLAAD